MPIVRIEKVSKRYRLGKQEVEALKNVDLEVEQGEFIALAGPSGSGKTTLLNLIGCIDSPTSGSIYINNVCVSGQTPDQLADLRARTIGFIFQTFNLLPVLSAEENIEYPLLQFKMNKAKRKDIVDGYLKIVQLQKLARHRPNELSGGQRQRVAIARALITDPTIVVADEPTGDLDRVSAEEILNLLERLNRAFGKTIVMVTHDPKAAEKAHLLRHLEKGILLDAHP